MRKNQSIKILVAFCAMIYIGSQEARGVTIEDPFLNNGEISVVGKGTAVDPFVLSLTESNHFINENGLSMMKEEAPEAIWLVEHKENEKVDYTLRFSSAIVDSVIPPFCLDVTAWQDKEGEVHVQVGENDSTYLPVTLALSVLNFPEFKEGTIVTVTGGANARAPVSNGFVELALDRGGDCLLTADGYETPPEEIEPELPPADEVWDKPNEEGETIPDNFVHAGDAKLPFQFNMSEAGITVVDGASFNELKTNGQSRLLQWKNEAGQILWSYLLESRRIMPIPDAARFDFANVFDGSTLTIAHNGTFPCKMETSIYVGNDIANAAIVKIMGQDLDTAAVVDRGYITFLVTQGGTYTITETGDTVKSRTVDDAKLVSGNSRDNMYTTQKYKGTGDYGTADEPLMILGKLDDFFWASWRSLNTVAGYSSDMNATEASYDPSTLMNVSIEYRSPTTGKLIASITIDGSQWHMTPENMKGPYYMDYKLNPSPAIIEKTLKSHSLYIGKYSDRRTVATETLTSLSKNPNAVLFLMSRTRNFAGAINYKLDMSNYFNPGDIVHFQYLLGACNGDLYHGKAPKNAELLIEEGTYSRYDGDYTVDAQGYVSFPLYTGGFFVFTKAGETEALTDHWMPGGVSAKAESGDEAKGVTEELILVEDPILIEEEVAVEKHTETGVLTDICAEEQRHSPNYMAESKGISVSGYLKDATTVFLASEQPSFGEAYIGFGLVLKKQSGFIYKMIEGDYLNVTLNLGGGYSVHDERLLYIKCMKNGVLTDEVFPACSEMSADGGMVLTFRTTHLGNYFLFRAEEEKELTGAVSLKQEYTSESTALLAEQSLKHKDAPKTMKYLLTITFAGLLSAFIISDIKRRRIK